jgi:hypothetical protein
LVVDMFLLMTLLRIIAEDNDMRFDRLDSDTLVQLTALAIVTFGLALGLAFIAYLDGGM